MLRRVVALFLIPLLIAGVLAPKLSALILHLSPHLTTAVICTGTQMITIHIGTDEQPVEVSETDHGPCVLADPEALAHQAYADWTQAPRSYRHSFVEITQGFASAAELGLLPDLRGPPVLV
jgi:hypothetical protein